MALHKPGWFRADALEELWGWIATLMVQPMPWQMKSQLMALEVSRAIAFNKTPKTKSVKNKRHKVVVSCRGAGLVATN